MKTGIEFEKGAPQLGTVATYAFSDSSLSPVVPKKAMASTFVVERNRTEMWVYHVVKGVRYPLREVTWVRIRRIRMRRNIACPFLVFGFVFSSLC